MFNLLKAEMEGPGYSRVEGEDLLSRLRVLLLNAIGTFYDRNFYPSLKYVNVVRKVPFRLSSPQRIDCLYAI